MSEVIELEVAKILGIDVLDIGIDEAVSGPDFTSAVIMLRKSKAEQLRCNELQDLINESYHMDHLSAKEFANHLVTVYNDRHCEKLTRMRKIKTPAYKRAEYAAVHDTMAQWLTNNALYGTLSHPHE